MNLVGEVKDRSLRDMLATPGLVNRHFCTCKPDKQHSARLSRLQRFVGVAAEYFCRRAIYRTGRLRLNLSTQ